MHRLRISLLASACAVVLAACIGGGADCGSLPTDIELTLTAQALTPSSIAVCRGDDVTLTVDVEVSGVLHIHGYDAEVPATNVTEGEVLELGFSADRSGQFPIELHTDENTQGVNVGLLTVDEP
ncbi:MAG: hypothetical protein ACRDFY_08245 [Candidatus Limnocylindria bacterium]